MKTFDELIKEVVDPGYCYQCGGCVTFCTAVNFGALTIDQDGLPCYADINKCVRCGVCYNICPVTDRLQEETKRHVDWQPPMGKVIETVVARSTDPEIRKKATDGGLVTALLVYLMKNKHIDGAIVTKSTGPFKSEPFLATTVDEIKSAAGFSFDISQGIKHFSDAYAVFTSSFKALEPVIEKKLERVALVGAPCQIKAMRKIETKGIVPSDSIRYHFGLFCSGQFKFGEEEQKQLEVLGGFEWKEVRKINVKENLMIHLQSEEIKEIPLDQLDFMKRPACRYCSDYAAEYADISFGGIGSPEGWTTAIARSVLGQQVLRDAQDGWVEIQTNKTQGKLIEAVEAQVKECSERKKRNAKQKRTLS